MLVVGIDGIDGAGKSTFADEVAGELRRRGRAAVRATIDSFHADRGVRWARGRGSPLGYYLDSHQLDVLRDVLLDRLRRSPSEPYCLAIFDENSDQPVELIWNEPRPGDVVVFDGIFLHRPELVDSWDLSVWLDGAVRVELARVERAVQDCSSDPVLGLVHLIVWWSRFERYVVGQQLYVDDVAPAERADIVIDNNHIEAPTIVRSRRA